MHFSSSSSLTFSLSVFLFLLLFCFCFDDKRSCLVKCCLSENFNRFRYQCAVFQVIDFFFFYLFFPFSTRYIEGLNNRSDTISDWKHSLGATKETVPISDNQKQRLPRHWFAHGVLGEDEDIANALWKMRDIMQNDFLQVSRAFQL